MEGKDHLAINQTVKKILSMEVLKTQQNVHNIYQNQHVLQIKPLGSNILTIKRAMITKVNSIMRQKKKILMMMMIFKIQAVIWTMTLI